MISALLEFIGPASACSRNSDSFGVCGVGTFERFFEAGLQTMTRNRNEKRRGPNGTGNLVEHHQDSQG